MTVTDFLFALSVAIACVSVWLMMKCAYLHGHTMGILEERERLRRFPLGRRMDSVDLVQVIWDDACHVRSSKDAKALRMMSFGVLLKEGTDGLVIAQSQSAVGEFLDCLYIPRGMVIDWVKIPLPVGKGVLPV